jgi:hypothetical protein
MRALTRNDARSGIGTAHRINMIARPTRQKLNRMTQLEPVASGEIGTELGDNLAFKPSPLSRFSGVEVFAGLIWAQIL